MPFSKKISKFFSVFSEYKKRRIFFSFLMIYLNIVNINLSNLPSHLRKKKLICPLYFYNKINKSVQLSIECKHSTKKILQTFFKKKIFSSPNCFLTDEYYERKGLICKNIIYNVMEEISRRTLCIYLSRFFFIFYLVSVSISNNSVCP